MRCTEVADRPFPDGEFFGRDIGDRGRSMADMMDFVAIDFETANEKRSSACAIGLTTVRDGQIVDSFSRLIRPPELRFSFWNSNVHGLTENDVKDSPTFDELWPELLPLLENQLVIAHNASFDISVLRHSRKRPS